MTNKKSIFKSVAVVTAFSVATRLFAFLFKVFVSRQFGASVVGVYQMALSFYFFRVGGCAQRTSDGDKPKDCRGRKNGRRKRTVAYFDRACFIAVVGTPDTFGNISRRFPFAVGFCGRAGFAAYRNYAARTSEHEYLQRYPQLVLGKKVFSCVQFHRDAGRSPAHYFHADIFAGTYRRRNAA